MVHDISDEGRVVKMILWYLGWFLVFCSPFLFALLLMGFLNMSRGEGWYGDNER